MSNLRLERMTAVTMDDELSLIEDAAIVIAGSQILYVGPRAGAPARADDEVFEAAGMVALPGLINAHTHLAMTLFRGVVDDVPLQAWLEEKIWPVEPHITQEDVYWASLLGIAEMLHCGVTTFNDMYWHVEAVTDAVRESGIRACLSGVVIPAFAEKDSMLERAIGRVKTLLALDHPRITPCFGPHAPYTVPTPLLRQIIDAAAELGVGIHTHLSETVQEVADCRREFGVTPIARMAQLGLFSVPVMAAHCVHAGAEDIELLAQTGAAVIHCPSSNMKLASGIAPVPTFLRAGVTVGLGTDGAGSNNTLSILREIHAAALLHKVLGDPTALNASQAVALATRGGAAALRRPDLGVLAPGKLADITLLDFRKAHLTPQRRIISDLAYAAAGSDVDTVIVHGKVLLRNGKLTTLDEERIIAKVNESAARLFK